MELYQAILNPAVERLGSLSLLPRRENVWLGGGQWAIPFNRHTPPTDDICPRGGRSGPWLSKGVDSNAGCPRGAHKLSGLSQGVQKPFSGCPRGAQKLSGLSQGGQNAMSQGVGCRWQLNCPMGVQA